MPGTGRQRRDDLDRAKGIAIVLVVFGHLVAREGPTGVGWYEPVRATIYLFHMPFFLFLSGYAAGIAGLAERRGWPGLARQRAGRLLLPFAAFGLLILAGKLALNGLLPVDNAPASPWAGLRALVWDTGNSPATSVWYLLALFVFSVATPPLWRAGGAGALAGAAVLLYALPAPPILYLDRVCGYFVFFAIGVLAARRSARWDAAVDRWRTLSLALFGAVLLAAWAGGTGQDVSRKAWMLLAGLLSMPALHGLARGWASTPARWLGRRAFPVYLLNTICIGLAKAMVLSIATWDGANFVPVAIVLMAAGLLGPLVVAAGAGAIAARAGGWFPVRPASVGSR